MISITAIKNADLGVKAVDFNGGLQPGDERGDWEKAGNLGFNHASDGTQKCHQEGLVAKQGETLRI
jgi:hypothetical protein